MTIKGFIDFVKSNSEFNQLIELNKTIVVFDGHLLQRRLNHFSPQSKEENKFSDYPSYAQTIRSFFRRLKVCQIVPIVVFDGSIDTNRYRRGMNERIVEIHQIIRNGYNLKTQSPTLRNYVFTSVARSFGVEVIQTCSDTWTQVAALANKLMCPIYSMKKEFYFLNVQNGILDDDSILKSRLTYNSKKKYWFLSVRLLRLDFLVKKFSGLQMEVMPLLGVIFENNFIDHNGYKSLSEEIKEWHKSDRIEVILNWIKGKSLDICLESIARYLNPSAVDELQKKGGKLRELLTNVKSNGNDSVIRKYLNESEIENENLKMLAKGDTEVVLPNWFVSEYQKGIIRPALMNIVKYKTHILYPQIEDFSKPSSYEFTLKLRRFLYGILRTEIDNPSDIRVLDRTKFSDYQCVSMKEVSVSPLLRISDSREVPYLGNVRHLELSERRKLFLSVMGVTEAFINRCKVSLLLLEFFEEIGDIDGTTFLIIITRYMIRDKPQFNWKPSIGALVLSIMFHSSQDLRSDLKWTNLSKIAFEERFKPQFMQFDAQIQACLHISNFINTVLEMPFEEGKPYFCLNGIFLYNAIRNLSDAEEYEAFLRYLFRSQPSLEDIFNDIKQLIELDLNV